MKKLKAASRAVLSALIAVSIAGTALALSPEAEKRKNAGNEYQKRREYDAARDQYMEALKIEPDYADAHYNLGMLYFYRLKEYPKALYHLNTYRRLETGASDMGQVLTHINQSIEHIEASEREDYKSAVHDGTIESFEKFLKLHPVGYYADHAREEIKKLLKYRDEKTKREAQELDIYARASASGSVEALDAFLAAYPTSAKADEARTLRMRIMERDLQEKLAYQKATGEDTPDALDEFVRAYPTGKFTEWAKSRSTHLKAAEESLALARETGSVTAMEKYLEIYSDTPYANQGRAILEEFRKAELEKTAAAEALRIMNNKKQAEAEAAKAAEAAAKAAQETKAAEAVKAAEAAKAADAAKAAEAAKTASGQQQKPAQQPTQTQATPAATQPPATPSTAAQAAPTTQDQQAGELSPKESDAKKRAEARAEAREKARRAMEAEMKRLKLQPQAPPPTQQ